MLKNSLLQIPLRGLIEETSCKIWDKPPKAVKIKHFQKEIFPFLFSLNFSLLGFYAEKSSSCCTFL